MRIFSIQTLATKAEAVNFQRAWNEGGRLRKLKVETLFNLKIIKCKNKKHAKEERSTQ